MKTILPAFEAALASHPRPPHYWIAYSGGLDSHVLLHLCARLAAQSAPSLSLSFHAIHVHHGLQPAADAWAEHCAITCRNLDLPYTQLRVDARPANGESPEEAARRVRYAAIRRQMGPGDIILTAQHADDQAETLMLQLLRGAGLAGLASMPAFSDFSPGFLLRPLLRHNRAELRTYAEAHELIWIEDPSNRDLSYDRNFIRHRVMPLLAERWPASARTLSRSAAHCAEALERLETLSSDLYSSVLLPDGSGLSVERLRLLTPADQRLVLRYWLKDSGYRMPPAAAIHRILHEVLPAAADKMPRVAWREGEIRRYRNGLFALPPLPPFDATTTLIWDGVSPLALPDNNGELRTVAAEAGRKLDTQAWQTGAIRVAYRRGGERCRLPGRAGTHTLKNLLQEAGIPPWLRERAPLVYIDGALAAIADWWVTAAFTAPRGDPGISLRWKTFAPAERQRHR